MKQFCKFTFLVLATCIGLVSCDKESSPYVASDAESDGEATTEEIITANESLADYDSTQCVLADSTLADTLIITWEGTQVTVAGVADGVEVVAHGGAVTVTSTTDSLITYILRGSSSDGNIKFYSEHKFVLTLDGVTLASQSTAAINNQCSKTLYLNLPEGTTSTLADAPTYTETDGEDCKACLFSEGQVVVCGTGTLAITGNSRHALATDDYLVMNEAATLDICGSAKDAIHTNDYIVIGAGTICVRDCGADGIDCEGAISIAGGTLDIETSATTGKCIKAVGDITIEGGTFTLVSRGDAEWNSGTGESADYSNAACIKTDGALNIYGGTVSATSTGKAGRGLAVGGDLNLTGGTWTIQTSGAGFQYNSSCDYTSASGVKVKGNMHVTGGTLLANVTGAGSKAIKVAGTYTQGDGVVSANASGTNLGTSSSGMRPGQTTTSGYSASAKGVKVSGAMAVTGGQLLATSARHEAIETKSTLDITGGEVYGYSASDDGINAASHFTIDGGFVCGYATGNDGLDANGNLYIKSGVVFAVGSSSPEMAVDANTEGGYKLYVTGGTLMTVGPLEGGASLTQSCYSASSWNKNTRYALTVGNDTYVFTTPSVTAGSGIVVSGASTPTLRSGVSVTGGTSHFDGVGTVVANGTVTGGTSVSLSAYTASGGMGGGGGQPGGGGRPW